MLNITHLKTCTSTNDEAWNQIELLQKNGKTPTGLVRTDVQTAGRGRQGRTWESAKTGNFYGSFFHTLSIHPHFTCVPLAAALAVSEALELIFPQVDWSSSEFRLKWPNDLYFGDRKLGGILCESKMQSQTAALVVGLGVNTVWAPELSEQKTTFLEKEFQKLESHFSFDVENFLKDFSVTWPERFLLWLEELQNGRTEGLRQQWLKRAKMDRFPNYLAKDANGNSVELKMQSIDSHGRLQAMHAQSQKTVLLDQPEFFEESLLS